MKKKTRILIAYCYRNGWIKFGPELPEGAIELSRGPAKKVRHEIGVRARHAYPKVRGGKSRGLLVPGVPEAENDGDALEALIKFSKWIRNSPVKQKAA